jgi:hypothetical protein
LRARARLQQIGAEEAVAAVTRRRATEAAWPHSPVADAVTKEVPEPLVLAEAVTDGVGEAVADGLLGNAAVPPQATPGGKAAENVAPPSLVRVVPAGLESTRRVA